MKRISLLGFVLLMIVSLYSCKSIDSLLKEGKYQEAYELAKTEEEKNCIIEQLIKDEKYKELFDVLYDNDKLNRATVMDKLVYDGKADIIKNKIALGRDSELFVDKLIKYDKFISLPSSRILTLSKVPQRVFNYKFVYDYVIPALIYYKAYIGSNNLDIADICLYYNISSSQNDFKDYSEVREKMEGIIKIADQQDLLRLCIVTNSGTAYVIDTNSFSEMSKGVYGNFKYGNFGVNYVTKLSFKYKGEAFNLYNSEWGNYCFYFNRLGYVINEQLLKKAIQLVK